VKKAGKREGFPQGRGGAEIGREVGQSGRGGCDRMGKCETRCLYCLPPCRFIKDSRKGTYVNRLSRV
jgi:hypothetical protein